MNFPHNLKLSLTGDGNRKYLTARFCQGNKSKSKKAHTLVLEAFVCPRPAGMQACHNDGDKYNNYVGNLRWGTGVENMKDFIKHGKWKERERNIVSIAREKTGLSQENFSKKLNVGQMTISNWERGVHKIPKKVHSLLQKLDKAVKP